MRRPAAWGLVLCLLVLGTGFYAYFQGLTALCPLCLTTGPLVGAISLLFLVVVLTHPRRFGCRFFSSIIALLSFTGLGISIRHLWVQVDVTSDLPHCDASNIGSFESISFTDAYMQVITGINHCQDTQALFEVPLTYLVFCVFVLLSVFSIFLLFRRIDRNIFR